jgi:hypothetical protein
MHRSVDFPARSPQIEPDWAGGGAGPVLLHHRQRCLAVLMGVIVT